MSIALSRSAVTFTSHRSHAHSHTVSPFIIALKRVMQAKTKHAKPHSPTPPPPAAMSYFSAQPLGKSVRRARCCFRQMEICSWEVISHSGEPSCVSKIHLQTKRKKQGKKAFFMTDTSTYVQLDFHRIFFNICILWGGGSVVFFRQM